MSDPNLEEILAWAEYDWAAEWCAKRGIENANGVFPDNLSARAWRLISADPESFASRIREFRYKLAIMTGPGEQTDQLPVLYRWRVVYREGTANGVLFIEAPSAIEAHFKAKREHPKILVLSTSPDRRDPS